MGDLLDDKLASNTSRIVGGDELNAAAVTTKKELKTNDSLGAGGLQIELTVGLTVVEGKVGASALPDRKYVIFQALDNGIFFGANNGVTIANGMPIFKSQLIMVPKLSSIWFIANAAGKKLRFIEEA